MAPSYTPHLGRILYPLLHTLMEPMRSRFKSEEAPETFLCHSVSKTRTATSFKQLFASWRLQDASAEQSLNSSPSLQLASRAEQAGSTRALAPHCRLQVDGGNCSKKCFSTSLPPPVLEINIKIHFSPFIAVLKLTCTPDMTNSPPHTILKRNNVKFYNSFSQWNISWTVSLKTNSDVHKQACLLWASPEKHGKSIKFFQLWALPQHFSAHFSDIIKKYCQDPQPLLKNKTTCQGECFSLSLTLMLCSSLVFIQISEEKSLLLLPEIKVCPCSYCVVQYKSNLASFRGCKINFSILFLRCIWYFGCKRVLSASVCCVHQGWLIP